MLLYQPLSVVRPIQYHLVGQEHIPNLQIGLEPSWVNVMYKSDVHGYTPIGEEDFLGQCTWLLRSMVKTTRKRNFRKRKETQP